MNRVCVAVSRISHAANYLKWTPHSFSICWHSVNNHLHCLILSLSTLCPSVHLMTAFICLRRHTCVHTCTLGLKRFQEVILRWQGTQGEPSSLMNVAYHSSAIIFLGIISLEWPPGIMAEALPGMSELRDNYPLAASDHAPTSNHSWPLVSYFPEALRELHFHFAAGNLMHCCNPPSGWSTFHARIELRQYLNC